MPGNRDAFTFSTRRAAHKHMGVQFKDPLYGVVVENPEPFDPAPNQTYFLYTGYPEYFVVPEGVTALRVSGSGGRANSTGINLGGAVFGAFEIPVTSGETLEVQVGAAGQDDGTGLGGWPDGGNGAPSVSNSAGGGGGSTRLTGAAVLFVAPGNGGSPQGADVSSGYHTYLDYGYTTSDWIGVSEGALMPAHAAPVTLADPYGGFYIIADLAVGGYGGSSAGGDGAAAPPGAPPTTTGGGGGGGGWGGGDGGHTYRRWHETDGDRDSSIAYTAIGGRAGGAYAIAGSTHYGDPLTIGTALFPPGATHLILEWTI